MDHEICVGVSDGTTIRATFSQKVDAFGDTSYSKTALRERLNGTNVRDD
uniref:Uncharacterized protein n=1 Tax=Candidatus Methanogaster sp. ANME-2c ERB4 TaxID=2759911 RepID=A0A7G9YKK5_9EURY|nr:hypothetical protein NKHFGJIK_00017 [Methanosarcinales archaeon ANME-2c ERB4]